MILVPAGIGLLFINYFKRLFDLFIFDYISDIFDLNLWRGPYVILKRLRRLVFGAGLLSKGLRSGVFLVLL
jgi:hypothetical protein